MKKKKKHVVTRREEEVTPPPRGVCILVPDEPDMLQFGMKILQAIERSFAETLEVMVLPYRPVELIAFNREVPHPEKTPHFIVLVTVRDNFRPLFSWISEWGASAGSLISIAGMDSGTQSLVIHYCTHFKWLGLIHKGLNSAVPAFLADAITQTAEHVKRHTPHNACAV